MTIGLGCVHSNGVLLAADGVTTLPYENNKVVRTDSCKITQIGSRLFCVCFGLEPLYLPAIEKLQIIDWTGNAVDEISNRVYECLKWSFDFGSQQIQIKINAEDTKYKAALIVGGLAVNGTFITAALCGSDIIVPEKSYKFAQGGYYLLGGESNDSQNVFKEKMNRLHREHMSNTIQKVLVLEAFVSTVRQMESLDRTIGGRVLYADIPLDSEPTISIA